MNKHLRVLVCGLGLLLAACSENPVVPTDPVAATPGRESTPQILKSLAAPLAQCQSVASAQATVDSLLPQLYSPGQGRRGKAQTFNNRITQARRDGNQAVQLAYMDSLVNYTLQNYYAGNLIGGQGEDTQARVLALIYALYCANGISPVPDLSGIFSAENTAFITNTTPTTTVTTGDNDAATRIEQGDVPSTVDGQPFFGTFISVYKTTDPLPTSLDWYGLDGYRLGAFEFAANPAVTFTSPVLSGVCIKYDDTIVTNAGDLRMAHAVPAGYVPTIPGNTVVTTSGGTIEIAAPASVSALNLACEPLQVAARSFLGRILERLAGVVLPSPLMAELLLGGGGIGGQTESFSPFAAVDTKLRSVGSGPSSPQYIPVGSTSLSTPVSLTVTTRNGNVPINGVPVSFTPADSFSPAAVATGLGGQAVSSWTLSAGSNAGTATPSLAPLDIPPASFAVTAIQLLPLVIETASLPGGQQGVAYGPVTLAASGGTGTFAWALAPGSAALPAGLTLSSAGAISGTPTTFGSFTFSVRVTSGPLTTDRSFTVTVAVPPVVIGTTSLPAGTVGVPYSQALAASGGDGSYSWSQVGGSLPAGIALAGGGVVSGVPTSPGTSTFTAQVSSAGGATTATRSFDLNIGYPSSLGTLVFLPGPSSSQCYALNAVMVPNIAVRVTTTTGGPVAGVRVDIVAVTNNGSKVAVSQPYAITGTNGLAVFNTLSINKTGAYRLIVSTSAPWPVTSLQSGKFNISPSC